MKSVSFILLLLSFNVAAECHSLNDLYQKEFEEVPQKLVLSEMDLDSKGELEGFAFDAESCGRRGCDTLIVSKSPKGCFSTLGIFFGNGQPVATTHDGYKDIAIHYIPMAVDKKSLETKTIKYSDKTKQYE